MDTVEDAKGSPSSSDGSVVGSPEVPLGANENSEATPASSISQSNTMPGPGKNSAEDEAENVKSETDVTDEADKNEGPSTSDNKVKKKPKLPADPDSDSTDSSDEDDDDSSFLKSTEDVNSKSIFRAFKKKMEQKAGRKEQKNQDLNLVKGLVDYLRVVEDRLHKVEASLVTNADMKAGPTHKPRSISSTVEITVKFFNSAEYLGHNGYYTDVHNGTEEGTFMCDHDTQHLIRVLYSNIRDEGAPVHTGADAEPPNTSDIDILTFGVTSDAIAAFFAKQIDEPGQDDHLIRFGKPFQPLMRNLGRARDQLKKLEKIYGPVVIEDVDNSRAARDSSVEAPDATTSRGESDVLPFAPTEDDGIQAFDRPAALPHFQAFLAFVDEYLGKQIQLYERLREGKDQHVAFENLWMLFDTNDTIYCPVRATGTEPYIVQGSLNYIPTRKHTPQAYRVVATVGGMPYSKAMTPVVKSKEADDSIVPDLIGSSLRKGPAVPLVCYTYMKEFNGDYQKENLKRHIKSRHPDLAVQIKAGARAGAKTFADISTQTAQISRNIRNNYTELHVYCFHVDFNGFEYGTVPDVFVFKPYEREMEIRSLQAYPANSVMRDWLHDRGESFLEATKICHLQYEGLTVGPNREEINSPVVMDVNQAFEGSPETKNAHIVVPQFWELTSTWLTRPPGEAISLFGKSNCPYRWCYNVDCVWDVYIEYQRKQRAKIDSSIKLVLEEYESEGKRGKKGLDRFKQLLGDNDLITLLPGAVPGFALRNRKWVNLSLTQLKTVEQNNEWDKLVLPRGHREMVQAMVETHTQEPDFSKNAKIGMDLIPGKGRGCIILLHGVPGVGKTSTAECVAAHTKRPLYPITCGDIGYRPEDVEKNMEKHFKLAHKWGCVLLLDEADVFLAKRDRRDVERNGLVSVFLRILEYYSGILFLTTNRVGAIDDAFRSRLHLTLYYPKLTKKQTKEIFKRNFERIAEINTDRSKNNLPQFEYKDSEPKIMEWAKETRTTLKWNGRQIRNTFQTVLALAEFQAKARDNESSTPRVTKKLFKIVANAAIEFNKYLLATHGADEDKVAGRESMRAASYLASSQLAFNPFHEGTSDSSSEEDESSDGAGTDSDSDESDEPDRGKKKKKKSKAKGEKESKNRSKKSKKTSEKKGKFEKKTKEKKKDKEETKEKKKEKEDEESDDTD